MRGERLVPFPAPAIHAPYPGAVRVLLFSALVALAPHVLELPVGAVLAFVASVAWRFGSEQWRWYQPDKWVRLVLTLAAIVLTYRHFDTLLGRDPGVTLLVCLTGLKLLELRSLRDYMLTTCLLFLVVLSTFLYAQSLAIGLYALAAVTVNTAALVRLSHAAWLPLGTTIRWTLTLMAQALPLMLVLYLLFPRLSGALWGVELAAADGVTGVPDVMRPGSLQRLSESTQPAFRASFDGSLPTATQLYWRGRVLWDSDGHAWYAGPPLATTETISFVPVGEPVRYEVTLEPQENPSLYVLDLPASVPAGTRIRVGYVLERSDVVRERYRYNMLSYPRYMTGALANAERARALALPRSVSARVNALAAQWRARADDPGVVMSALDYFRREPFAYTLTPPALGADPVDEFLFDTRRGFCEHYASAFVTLMRAAGVPSRVVIGYQGGELNPTGNYLLVRQADAHAWAEVWLRGRGWVRVDPTAAVAPERVELGIDAVRRLRAQDAPAGGLAGEAMRRALEFGWIQNAWVRTRFAWDYANFSWYRWVSGYDIERQEEFLARFGIKDHVLLFMTLGVALLVVCYARLNTPRGRNDPLVAAYRSYCQRLAGIGLDRAPHEGALAFAQRCLSARPDLARPVREITENYLTLRYGATHSKSELRALRRAVRRFRPRRAA